VGEEKWLPLLSVAEKYWISLYVVMNILSLFLDNARHGKLPLAVLFLFVVFELRMTYFLN
jgi:antibiotic biosynthesis monooxygenase (ABM) superfamily enzyme